MTEERMVKGSIVSDMVKVVNALKDLPWDQHLKKEDFEIINSMVLPTGWYPLDFYQRVGNAVYKLVANEDIKAASIFGETAMKELYEGPYRPFLDKGDPHVAIAKFLELRRGLFNFSNMVSNKTGEKSIHVLISELGDYTEGMEPFQILIGVHFEKLIEYNGGQNVKMKTEHKLVDGDSKFDFDLEWE
jgi:hypothetical protein